MADCIFCDILQGKLKSETVYKDDTVVAFRDINPQAPVHILIVPRKHIPTLNDLTHDDLDLVAQTVAVSKKLAKQEGIAENGYRLVWNCNREAGQEVYHIHLHLLGGRRMGWPPG